MLGLIAFFSGPAIERSKENPENWTINTKFHKFTDVKAIIFRVVGLVIVYYGYQWLFSTKGSALKSADAARVVFGFGFALVALQLLIIIRFGRKFVDRMKDLKGMIDLEVIPARLCTSIVFLAWIMK